MDVDAMREHEREMQARAERRLVAETEKTERRALVRRVIAKYDWRGRARAERELEASIAERRAA